MAVVNTGIVLRTITGVNESDLFLGSESTSVATNTGIVERSILGVHDANFVHPLGDEDVLNGDFSNGSTSWSVNAGITITDKANFNNVSGAYISQNILTAGKSYKLTFDITDYTSGNLIIYGGAVNDIGSSYSLNAVGSYTIYFVSGGLDNQIYFGNRFTGSIDNISVKEMLVNRESTATNTGIVERSLTGVNESDPMFPDNTISNIVNIAGLISSLIADLKARATTFENEDATRNILINLQNC